jgi:diguanylate cyclase (GGDEF)-like protein
MIKSDLKPVRKGKNNDNRLKAKLFNVAIYFGKVILVAIAYFLAAILSLQFSLNESNISLIWLPSGIALAALLIFGWQVIPGVILGAFTAAFSTAAPFSFALTTAIGNPLAALVSALLICRGNKFPCLKLDSNSSLFSLIFFGVLLGPVISATIGSLGMLLSNMVTPAELTAIWSSLWLGDALGVLVFTPFFLVWSSKPTPILDRSRKFEVFAIFVLFISLEFILLNCLVPIDTFFQLSFLIFPLSIWAALRLDIRGVPTLNLLAMGLNVWALIHLFGSFLQANLLSSLIYLGTNSILNITSLYLAVSVIEQRSLRGKLAELSTHDALTGLYNRLYFETEMERLSKSRQYPISIIMADVDELKTINDTLGHQKGDQVLINVARLFTSVFRQEDIVARLSGDEFVVLLPATDSSAVVKIFERVRSQISVFNIEHPALPINLSIGSATAQTGQSLIETLQAADQDMYLQKRTRRKSAEGHLVRQSQV